MNRKLLIWDIDGTLIDCGAAGRKAMNRTFKEVFQIDNGFEGISMSGRLDQVILKEAFDRHSLNHQDVTHFYERYKNILDEILKQTEVKLYAGILDVLDYTESHHNIINVISTGNCEVGAWLKLKHAGIDQYFEQGGFGCSFVKREDLVGQTIKVVEKKHSIVFDPKDIIVIGDTPYDIMSGQHHRTTTIAVLTGSYSRQELLAYKPTYIIDNFEDLNEFIGMLEV